MRSGGSVLLLHHAPDVTIYITSHVSVTCIIGGWVGVDMWAKPTLLLFGPPYSSQSTTGGPPTREVWVGYSTCSSMSEPGRKVNRNLSNA